MTQRHFTKTLWTEKREENRTLALVTAPLSFCFSEAQVKKQPFLFTPPSLIPLSPSLPYVL